jgi:hypothetical protein
MSSGWRFAFVRATARARPLTHCAIVARRSLPEWVSKLRCLLPCLRLPRQALCTRDDLLVNFLAPLLPRLCARRRVEPSSQEKGP